MDVEQDTPTWNDWREQHLEFASKLKRRQALRLRNAPFLLSARSSQRPPMGNWRTWLFMGGRGAGKTRAGAEWTRFAARFGGYSRIALVGPTLGDVREVMIEGASGLRSIEPWVRERPFFNVSRRRLEWPNGAVAYAFSAEDPDSLRGPQFDAAWCDEIGVWVQGETVWSNLQLGLRLGDDPRCVATTTPRSVPLVRTLVERDAVLTRGSTRENFGNLAPGFVEAMEATYSGTQLGRQELEGELVENLAGALWYRSDIDRARVCQLPEKLDDIIVAIDPPASAHSGSDACGIIVAGKAQVPGFGARCFILADGTVQGVKPSDWAARAHSLASDAGATCIVAEANQGGEMVRTVLESVQCSVPIRLVHARLSKRARAAPIAALYARGVVSHFNVLKDLEDEMCRFGAEGFVGSPDRVDALVWAVTTLMINRQGAPRIRAV